MKQYQEEFEHMQADLHSIPRDEMRARYDNLEKLTGERYPRGSPRHIEFLEYVIRKRNERIDELEGAFGQMRANIDAHHEAVKAFENGASLTRHKIVL